MKIAVGEACSNAIQYANAGAKGGVVIVGFGIYQDKLEMMVTSSGKSFNFSKTQTERSPYTESNIVEHLLVNGLGLYLIETLMDEVRVMNHSDVTVFMMKRLGGERENHDESILNGEKI